MRGKWHAPLVWSARQRSVVLGIIVSLTAYLAVQSWRNPVRISDPQPMDGERSAELRDRIDPNTADAAMLGAIPTLGEKRAEEIVSYRLRYAEMNHGEPAFLQPRDLLKVKGIGVSMMANLEPYLIFPTPASATAPTTAPGD